MTASTQRKSGRLLPLAFALGVALLAQGAAAVTLASSDFTIDAEGWGVFDLPYPNPGWPPLVLGSYTPSFNASGGNPGGHLSRLDVSDNAWYWSAPAKYLGDIGAAYGGTLSYSMAVTGNGFGNPPNFTQEDVILVGGGTTLVYDTGRVVLPTQVVNWTVSALGLSEAGWKVGTRNGVAATADDMHTALGSLSALYIRGEYLRALDDIGRLDNVVLTAVPEPSALALFGAGLAVLLVGRARRKFT